MTTLGYQKRRFLFIPLILVAIAAFSVATMLIWNELMPFIFHLPTINFWQALGLLILGRMFFGGGKPRTWWGGSYWRYGLQERLSKMSPQERDEFIKKMRHRHNYCNTETPSEPKAGENDNPE